MTQNAELKGFKHHTGTAMPPGVGLNSWVVYRTVNHKLQLSRVHLPVQAKYVNWSKSPIIGRVFDYKVVNIRDYNFNRDYNFILEVTGK